MSTRTKKQIAFWVVCVLLYYSIFSNYQKFYKIQALDTDIFNEFMVSVQKMLFNNSIIYAVYMQIQKENFLTIEITLRYNKRSLNTLWLPSILHSLSFTAGMYTIWFLIALVNKLTVDFSIFRYFAPIFAYDFKISAVYLLIYVISKNNIYSFFAVIIWSVLLLIAYLGLGFVGIHISGFITFLLNPIYCIILALILLIVSTIIIRKRDYL